MRPRVDRDRKHRRLRLAALRRPRGTAPRGRCRGRRGGPPHRRGARGHWSASRTRRLGRDLALVVGTSVACPRRGAPDGLLCDRPPCPARHPAQCGRSDYGRSGRRSGIRGRGDRRLCGSPLRHRPGRPLLQRPALVPDLVPERPRRCLPGRLLAGDRAGGASRRFADRAVVRARCRRGDGGGVAANPEQGRRPRDRRLRGAPAPAIAAAPAPARADAPGGGFDDGGLSTPDGALPRQRRRAAGRGGPARRRGASARDGRRRGARTRLRGCRPPHRAQSPRPPRRRHRHALPLLRDAPGGNRRVLREGRSSRRLRPGQVARLQARPCTREHEHPPAHARLVPIRPVAGRARRVRSPPTRRVRVAGLRHGIPRAPSHPRHACARAFALARRAERARDRRPDPPRREPRASASGNSPANAGGRRGCHRRLWRRGLLARPCLRGLDLDPARVRRSVLPATRSGWLRRRAASAREGRRGRGRKRDGGGRAGRIRAAVALRPPDLARLHGRAAGRRPALGEAARPALGRAVPRRGRAGIVAARRDAAAGRRGPERAAVGRAALRPRPRLRPHARVAARAGGAPGGEADRPPGTEDRGGAEEPAVAPVTVATEKACTLRQVPNGSGSGRTALVTGGAGFIGSHLSEALLAAGWDVFALDDVSTGSLENVAHLRDRPDFHLVVDSVLSPSIVSELVHKVDVVYHLAAAVGVRLIVEQPVHTMVTNVEGTETVLGYASRFGKRVLVASSSEVYGDHREERPLAENDRRVYGPTTEKRWLYADSKAMDEHLARGLDSVIVRLFNTVGPRQSGRYGMVIPRFAEQALAGAPLEVHGDGTQTRSFCHVSDTVRALKTLMDAREISGEIFNVGSSERITILDLADRVRQAAGSGSEIAFVPYDEVYGQGIEDTLHREPAIGKIREAVGWEPTLDLARIIRDVIEHARAAAARPQPE